MKSHYARSPNGFARPTPTDHPSSLSDVLTKHCYFLDVHRQRRIRHGWRISAGVRCWPAALRQRIQDLRRIQPHIQECDHGYCEHCPRWSDVAVVNWGTFLALRFVNRHQLKGRSFVPKGKKGRLACRRRNGRFIMGEMTNVTIQTRRTCVKQKGHPDEVRGERK